MGMSDIWGADAEDLREDLRGRPLERMTEPELGVGDKGGWEEPWPGRNGPADESSVLRGNGTASDVVAPSKGMRSLSTAGGERVTSSS